MGATPAEDEEEGCEAKEGDEGSPCAEDIGWEEPGSFEAIGRVECVADAY